MITNACNVLMYLSIISVSDATWCKIIEWLVNGEYEAIWKEAVVVFFDGVFPTFVLRK